MALLLGGYNIVLQWTTFEVGRWSTPRNIFELSELKWESKIEVFFGSFEPQSEWNLKELENELKNVPKSKVVSIKNSKTGTFQTAGAAQPIELSKKRRHFQLGFLKIIFEKFLKN